MSHTTCISKTFAALALLGALAAGCTHDEVREETTPKTAAPSTSTEATATIAKEDTLHSAMPTTLDLHPDVRVKVSKGKAFVMQLDGMMLAAVDSAVLHDGTYTATALHEGELPALPSDHVNVTAGSGAGYRLLPGGEHFSPYAELRVAYDEGKLPKGYTPDDIHTSYYDTETGVWMRLVRKEVDTLNKEIVSLTTHFTDFVNEVLKAPEMPETQAFVPTMMSELEAANPMEGLALIQPPTANNNGTANLSYPLQIPAGRQGMQPNLALTYNSGGGSGWLGVGWDLSIPSITVETRWGVPRYDSQKESEVYLLGGEQLVTKDEDGQYREMPHRTTQWVDRLPDGTMFFPRMDEAFDSIVRHGNSPNSYWWSVTHKNGVTDYYGKLKSSDSVDHQAGVLADDNGNIAKWMLTESRDLDGNSVLYYYDTVWDSGVEGGRYKGRQIYPAYIIYTNKDTELGPYKVEFFREDNHVARQRGRRYQSLDHTNDGRIIDMPVTINCRYGFKEVTSSLLSNISVTYKDSLVREYIFNMECGPHTNNKALLRGIEIACDPDSAYTTNTYTQDLYGPKSVMYRGEGGYNRFEIEYYTAPEALYSDPVNMGEKWQEYDPNQNDPYSSDVQSTGFAMTPQGLLLGSLNTTALGSSRGSGWSVGGGVSAGLGVSVFWTEASVGGNYTYSKSHDEGYITLIDIDGDGLPDKVFKDSDGNINYRKNIALDSVSFAFGEPIALTTIDNFQESTGSSHDFGLQVSLGASLTGSRTVSKSHVTTYFADVNADGLVDLVTDNGVYFNDLVDGVPTFSTQYNLEDESTIDTIRTGAMPCGYILYEGEINDSIYCTIQTEEVHEFYKYDSDLEWQIPSVLSRGLTVDSISSDTIYATSHRIVCDSGGLHRSSSLFEPEMEAVKVWVAPYTGNITITDSIKMIPDSTGGILRSRYVDGVRYAVQFDSIVDTSHTDHLSCLSRKWITELCGNLSPEDSDRYRVQSIDLNVHEGDILYFRLQSGSSHSFDRTDWRHNIIYNDSSAANDIYGRPNNTYNSVNDYVVTGSSYFQAPENGTVHISVSAKAGQLKTKNTTNSAVISTQKFMAPNYSNSYILNSGATLNNQTVTLNGYSEVPVSKGDVIFMVVGPSSGIGTTFGNLVVKPHYRFTPASYQEIKDTVGYDIPAIHAIQYRKPVSSLAQKLFGPLYRGWGQFSYRTDGTSPDSLIKLERLIAIQDQLGLDDTMEMKSVCEDWQDLNHSLEELSSEVSGTGNYNPLDTANRWHRMEPDSRHQAWLGYGNNTVISRTMSANVCPEEFYATGDAANIIEIDCPAPAPSNVYPHVRTHARSTKSETYNIAGSIGIGSIGLGASKSWGTSTTLSDYLDLNGDRYPDVTGTGGTQYTKPYGGLETNVIRQGTAIAESGTGSWAQNVSVDGGKQDPMPMFGKVPRLQKIGSKPDTPTGGGGGGHVGGHDTASFNYLDMNGDGLPDIVYSDGNVRLNIGYSFMPKEQWNHHGTHIGKYDSYSASGSINIPFNKAKFSIGGGMSMGVSDNDSEYQLLDVNGDGLPDSIALNGNAGIVVSVNMGNGHWERIATDLDGISSGSSYSENLNVAVTAGGTISFAKITGTLSVAPCSRSFSCDRAQFIDLNGDGLPDYATSNGEGRMTVRYNQTGRTNLLKSVTNEAGGTFELEYAFVSPTYEQPQGQWVMSSCRVSDDWEDAYAPDMYNTFSYRNPHYDRFERTSFGYDTVITCQHTLSSDGTTHVPYRYNVEGYHNKSYPKRGRKKSQSVNDATGKRYDEVLYEMTMVDRESGDTVGDAGCPLVVYPSVDVTVTNHYEGEEHPLMTTAESFIYDSRHNVSEYVNWGDTNHIGDEVRMKIGYLSNQPNNLTGLRSRVIVYATDSTAPLRKSVFEYDNYGLGHLVTRKDYYSATQWATTEYSYDSYGNTEDIWLPDNGAGQNLSYFITYDPVVHTYPISVSDSYGRTSLATYKYHFGKPILVTDVSGNQIRYAYDNEGRLISVTAPNELASGAPYTWYATYRHRYFRGRNRDIPSTLDLNVSYTHHYDPEHPSNPISTVTICDGWGRVVQVKKDADVNSNEVSVVSGREDYDALGRVVGRHDPLTEPIGTPNRLNTAATTLRSGMRYDILDRNTSCTTYHNSSPLIDSLRYGYSTISGCKMAYTWAQDAEGNTSTTYTDGRGLKRLVIDALGGNTEFYYDALGQCAMTKDPENFSTSYLYDMLGRLIQRDHPDAGNTKFGYAPCGLLQSQQDANGDQISYSYNYGQLIKKEYSRLPQNNAYYTYDVTGRLASVLDGSGYQEFFYDAMGNISRNLRTFAVPNSLFTYTFDMHFHHDSWGRMTSITYPDMETVSYHYDHGGNLLAVDGVKSGTSYPYIRKTKYDMYGNKTHVEYGNRTYAEYQYDDLQRLQRLRSYAPTSGGDQLMQDISYSYDNIANITEITNGASRWTALGMGGTYDNTYQYDPLSRLVRANGNASSHYNFGSMDMVYSPSGRLEYKILPFNSQSLLYGYCDSYQPHAPKRILNYHTDTLTDLLWDRCGNLLQLADYHLYRESVAENARYLYWAPENRLHTSINDKRCGYYVYDHSGERTLKLGGKTDYMDINATSRNVTAFFNDVTLYTSPYLVATNKGYTKHYYAGAERLAARIGGGGIQNMMSDGGMHSTYNNLVEGLSKTAKKLMNLCMAEASRDIPPNDILCINGLDDFSDRLLSSSVEKAPDIVSLRAKTETNSFENAMHLAGNMNPDLDVFFYHSDHLGSASWITDRNGTPVQHLQYLPFGERFVDEHTSYQERFTFTGKETDCETGFSYFGARYYDPTLLTGWTAVDPMSDKYPSLSPYNYCAWNPMKLVDPDGRDAVEEDDFPPIFDFFRSAAKKRERFIKKNPDWKAVCNGIIDNEGRTTFYARNHTTGSVEENSDFGEGGVNLPAVNITEKQFTDGDGYHFLHHTLRRFDNSLVGSNDAALESRLDRNEIEAGLKVVSYMTFAGASIESICAKKGLQIAGNLLGLGSSLMGELDNEHRDFFNIINMGLSTYGLLSTSGPANVINDCVTLGSSTYNISNSKEQKSTHHNDN